MHHLRITFPVATAILLALVYFISKSSPNTPQDLEESSKRKLGSNTYSHNPKTKPPSTPKPLGYSSNITLLPTAESSRDLHTKGSTAQDDLSLIHTLIRSHRQAVGGNPIGLNDEITTSLTGRNSKGAASLLPEHPAISDQGELLDRWQTPYRFHAYSGKIMEIRSAGPDRKFFNSDDIVLRE